MEGILRIHSSLVLTFYNYMYIIIISKIVIQYFGFLGLTGVKVNKLTVCSTFVDLGRKEARFGIQVGKFACKLTR